MSKLDQTEVLVVGAGPVGMLTALLLTQNGIRTRIMDQESRTAGHSYSCALHPRSIKLLSDAGIAAQAVESGHRIASVGFYEGNARRAEVNLAQLPVDYPFALVLDQSALETLLERKLREAGVKIHWGHRLAHVDMKDLGATAIIERLATTGKGYSVPDFEQGVERTLETQADFVIGADGSNSVVRRRLGIRFERTGAPQHFAVYEMEAGSDCGHETKVVLDPAASSALWPMSDTRCRWGFQVNPDDEAKDFPSKDRERMAVIEPPGERDSLHRLRQFLKERAPWFDNPIREVIWTTNVQFEPRLARQFGRNRCWLVGDAAHQTGPVGMQSMNIGFREAVDLVESLTQILRKNAPEDLLRAYDRTHWCEWQRLLGFKAVPPAADKASEWVRQRAVRIASCIPASGADLSALLSQLGIEF